MVILDGYGLFGKIIYYIKLKIYHMSYGPLRFVRFALYGARGLYCFAKREPIRIGCGTWFSDLYDE